MKKLFLKEAEYRALVKALAERGSVYACVDEEGKRPRMIPVDEAYEGGLKPASIRTVEPLKALFFSALENVGNYMGAAPPSGGEHRELFIVGVKSCDLRSLEILDHVFGGGDFEDPFYVEKRSRTTIISSDCTACVDGCFCELLDIRPYPTGNYDMNLSPVEGGYVVETGSEKGQSIVQDNGSLFSPATAAQAEEQKKNRESLSEKLKEQSAELEIDADLSRITSEGFEDEVWSEEAVKCVECGACNFICPTCHCFILSDHGGDEGYERIKRWDACQYAGFSRVAGGESPMSRRSQRLRNRYDKKFIFFPARMNTYACTGCGRCVLACPGNIDIREVLKSLSSRKKREVTTQQSINNLENTMTKPETRMTNE